MVVQATRSPKQIMDGAGAPCAVPGGMKASRGGFAAMMKGIVRGLKILGKAAMNPNGVGRLRFDHCGCIGTSNSIENCGTSIEAMGKVIMNVMMGVGAQNQ